MGDAGHNPADRSKLEIKKDIIIDKECIHLSTFITSANIHDVIVPTNTIDIIIIKIFTSN